MSRSNKASSDDETLLVKLLIPSASAGIILGKGGEAIICLQSKSCTNIKLSKAGDFFPGTMERVCVVLGSQAGIRSVLDVIVEKIRDKPDSHGVPAELKVKLVVPQSTAAMIVGKSGEYLAWIEKESSARVHVGQKNDESSFPERIVTVQGETRAMSHALDLILETIFSDPLSNSCPNVSYSDVQLVSSLTGAAGSSAASQLHTGIIPNHPSFAMLRYSLRFCGYAESAIEEVVAAVYTLASYGFLSLADCNTDGSMDPSLFGVVAAAANQPYPGCLPGSSTATNYNMTVGTSIPTSENYAMTASGFADNSSANAGGLYGPYHGLINSGNYSQSAAYQYFGQGTYNSSDYSTPNSLPPPPPPPAPQTAQTPNSAETVTQSFEVGEHIVGALLGPGGRSIIDLQTWSGASVEVSKKGIFAPGTRNRIVTVTGSALAVQSAAYFIKQCIDHEEMRRSSSAAQPSLQSSAVPPTDITSQTWPTPQQTAR